ncbi:hypothetical protein GN316_06515 [Xylophilus sp. Kf1]|nr:hypothetical protein [Xylophilus sp. Kf1]
MGEITEMMLDGTLCEGCGCHLTGEADGVPRYCRGCGSGKQIARAAKVTCSVCQKRVKAMGLADHMKDAHGVPKTGGAA